MFDAKPLMQIDDAFTEQLTDQERRFIKARADGLSLLAAWRAADGELYPGWRGDARDLERRLSRRRAEAERPYRAQAIEREQQRARTAPLRRELCAGLQIIINADLGAAIGDDGRLDLKALKASGIGPAIRSLRWNDDGKLCGVSLYSRAEVAKLLARLA